MVCNLSEIHLVLMAFRSSVSDINIYYDIKNEKEDTGPIFNEFQNILGFN